MESGAVQASRGGLFAGGSEIATRMRATDWAATPLGPIQSWPVALRTTLAMVLASRQPLALLWGPEHVHLFNDAWAAKLPSALAKPARESWASSWPRVAPRVADVMAHAVSSSDEDAREGESGSVDAALGFSFSPVFVDEVTVGGALVVATERAARLPGSRPATRSDGELERQALVAALGVSEARYRALFESLDEGYCLLELLFDDEQRPIDYRFLEANRAFEEQTGLRDALGKTARQLVPTLDESWFRLYGDVALTGRSARFENHAPAMGRWFDVYASRVGPAEARQVALVFKDVTARKEAESARERALEEARRSQAEAEAERRKLHAVFMQAPVAICTFEGPEHTFTFANPRYLELVGDRDVLGKPLHVALPDVRALGFDRLLDRVASTGEIVLGKEVEVTLATRPSGEPIVVDFTYQAMRDADGGPAGILAVVIDVTSQVTARKQVADLAEQLRLREAQLRMVTDHLPVLVSFIDRDERYRFANRAYEEWFGMRGDQLYGRAVREVIGEAAYAVLGPYVRRGLAGERFSFEQHDVPYRHGGTRDVKVTFVPSRGEGGVVEGYVALSEDITQRRRLERDRDRLAQQRADVLESMRDAYVALDREWRVILANAEQERIARMSREEMLGRAFWDVLPVAAARDGKYWAEYERCMVDRVPVQFVDYYARLDLWADVRAYPTSDGGIAIFFRDVSAQHRAEASRTALFQALTDQPIFGVAVMRGPELILEMANEGYRRFLGNREVVGKPLREAIPEAAGQDLEALLSDVVRTGRSVVGHEKLYYIDATGSGRPEPHFYDFSFQALAPATVGSDPSVLVFAHDVSEVVRARDDAAKLARAATERSDFEQQLIGIVSHDLRNPLNAILLGTSVLAHQELEGVAATVVLRIQSSAERMSRMVKDLLDFTQARAGGGIKVERRAMDLHPLVRQTADEVQASHPHRELRVESAGDGHGEWDGDRLAQVVQNLVSNALKYSPPDTPVHVRTRGVDGTVTIEVHNAGTPIPKDAQERLFQPMQRAAATMDRADRSVGLGLYIVKHLVDAHGGTIRVTSTEAAGTTFAIELPRTRTDVP